MNVGGHRVAMTELRDLFVGLGFADVATYIASGNVLFKTPSREVAKLEKRIETHLERALGYDVDTFVRTPEELAAIAAFQPFEDAHVPGYTLFVNLLRSALGAEAEQTWLAYRTPKDDFRFHGRELYWLCRGRPTESEVTWQVVMKVVPKPSTMRTVGTIRKLAAKCSGG
jgi:uncharacterized protein (DUF1697 family)